MRDVAGVCMKNVAFDDQYYKELVLLKKKFKRI